MVGDTIDADMKGPRAFGIHGYHLDRRYPSSDGAHSVHTLHEVVEIVHRLS